MIGTELGDLRRTHYSTELNSLNEGTDVVVMGWVVTVRGHGNIVFATIRDKLGNIQVITKSGECEDDIREKLSHLKEHSSIAVVGKTRKNEKSPTGIEVVPSEMRVFSEVEKIPPFEPYAKTVKNIDTRLEVRAIDLRRNVLQKIFLARSVTLRALRDYLSKEDFVEINTPKMIATATEGGAALFPIFYYNKEAFLAQSPQLYKEQLTMSFEKVFEIAPIFRAEPSRTNRHLSEAISIDFEEAYVDYNDVMDRIEELIKSCISTVQNFVKENPDVEFTVPEVPDKIPRYKYAELIEKMQNASKFNQGFANTEYLAASFLDMDWHTLTTTELQDTNSFEEKSLKKIGLIDEIVSRYRTTYFQHIFTHSYSAGYYSYIWAAVLDSDAFAAFKDSGDVFNEDLANKYREFILEKGGTEDPMELYRSFKGDDPDISALLEDRGLN